MNAVNRRACADEAAAMDDSEPRTIVPTRLDAERVPEGERVLEGQQGNCTLL